MTRSEIRAAIEKVPEIVAELARMQESLDRIKAWADELHQDEEEE